MAWFKKILLLEIGIEIKACLYFSIILFYYFLYQILQGDLYASIPIMVEMVLTVYAMNYVQVYLLKNFDEAERFDSKMTLLSVMCASIYTAISYFLSWYDRSVIFTAGFFFYMLLCYGCVFLIYKIKRDIDTVKLNQELEAFKNRKNKVDGNAS